MLRILIADDFEIVRHGLRSFIAASGNWQVCGEARIGTAAYALALKTRPDIVILDITLSGLGGISLARLLREDLPDTKALVLTTHDDVETVTSAVAAGVKGYVLKNDGERQLAAAIEALSAGRSYFSPTILDLMLSTSNTGQRMAPTSFTARELLVIELIANGHTNNTIAKLLGISVKTVESHRASALRKAGASTGPELVRFAIRHKLIA